MDLVRLSGLEVGTDIEIKFTGMRPGEKLFEETFFTTENVLPTEHPKVLRVRSGLLADGISKRLDALSTGAETGASDDDLRVLLQSFVPDFRGLGSTEEEPRPAARRAAQANINVV
jgi:FlaA1/EpsC-like NDP-sugar epimerase